MLFLFHLFGHRLCAFHRVHAGPRGWSFLRNYKRLHRDRIEEAIQQAGLGSHVVAAERAYDETGRRLPEKIAVYADSQEVASLFFQFYAQVKAAHQREVARSFGSDRKHSAQ